MGALFSSELSLSLEIRHSIQEGSWYFSKSKALLNEANLNPENLFYMDSHNKLQITYVILGNDAFY